MWRLNGTLPFFLLLMASIDDLFAISRIVPKIKLPIVVFQFSYNYSLEKAHHLVTFNILKVLFSIELFKLYSTMLQRSLLKINSKV